MTNLGLLFHLWPGAPAHMWFEFKFCCTKRNHRKKNQVLNFCLQQLLSLNISVNLNSDGQGVVGAALYEMLGYIRASLNEF